MPKAHGLLHVYDPDPDVPTVADIVFVHGLFGDRKETWTKHLASEDEDESKQKPAKIKNTNLSSLKSFFSKSKPPSTESEASAAHASPPASAQGAHFIQGKDARKSDVFWPKELLPIELPNCRILSWGYDVDIDHAISSASTATIYNHAFDLLTVLTDDRMTDELRTRPLIFIAHSLGGIVVKDALNESLASQTHLKEVASATFGICFLGTPHRGTSVAALGETVFRISKLWWKSPNLQILQSLKYDAETLDRIQTRFKQTLHSDSCKIRVRSFREAKKTHGFTVVDRFSSIIDDVREIVSDIDSDHRNMTKFAGLDDPGFVSVWRAVYRWIAIDMKDLTDNYLQFMKVVSEDIIQRLRNDERQSRFYQVKDAFHGTFSWLFGEEISFVPWLSDFGRQMGPIFWIQGKPGSGKSTLMKYIIENDGTLKALRLNEAKEWIKISFFASDRGSYVQKSIGGLLKEIIYQLCLNVPVALEIIMGKHLVQSHGQSSSGSGRSLKETYFKQSMTDSKDLIRHFFHSWHHLRTVDDMIATILAIFNDPKACVNIVLFIDGLDEFSDDHRQLIEVLQKLVADENTRHHTIKLCLSSRPEASFKFAFGSCPGVSIHDYTRSDIELFAYGRMRSTFLNLDEEPDTLSELRHLIFEMTDKANGVFIWVRLVVDELIDRLSDGCSISELRKVLSHIPEELEDLYKRIIARQKKGYAYESYIMIQALLRARHRLNIKDINAITDVMSLNRIEEMSSQSMKRRLASRCGGLIETIDASDNLQFLHQTVKAFFEDDRNIHAIFGNRIEAPLEDGLIFYLKFSIHIASVAPIKQVEAYPWALTDLFTYAALVETVLKINTLELLDRLLQPHATITSPDNCGLTIWEHYAADTSAIGKIRTDFISSSQIPRSSKLLALATSFGLLQYLRSKLDIAMPSMSGSSLSLLCCAIVPISYWDLEEAGLQTLDQVRLLLKHGVNPNERLGGGTALGLLLARQPGFRSSSPSRTRNLAAHECLKILLESGADPNLKCRASGGLRSPLSHVLEYSSASDPFVEDMVKLLIDHGADCNLKDYDAFAPLFFAIERENRQAVRLLLGAGADPTDIGPGIDALRPETCKGRPLLLNAILSMGDILRMT